VGGKLGEDDDYEGESIDEKVEKEAIIKRAGLVVNISQKKRKEEEIENNSGLEM